MAKWILPFDQTEGDSKNYHEWTANSGSVSSYENVIVVELRFDGESIKTLHTKNLVSQGFGLEIDIVERNNGSKLKFDSVWSDFPDESQPTPDTNLSDSINEDKNAKGLLVRDTRFIKEDTTTPFKVIQHIVE